MIFLGYFVAVITSRAELKSVFAAVEARAEALTGEMQEELAFL